MAYQFAYGKMASIVVPTDLGSVLVLSNISNVASVANAPEGAFLALGNAVSDSTYAVNGYTAGVSVEYDAYYGAAPAAATDEAVVLDPEVIESMVGSNGQIYRMGTILFNKQLPAGQFGRFRRLELHDQFWLGDSNFVSAPTVGQFGILTAGDFRLTPSATATANLTLKIKASKDLTAGMGKVGTSYLCEVVAL
jgi:hypothetical protein